jgi:TonB-dependent SusC/RagA subfamily outer membrane receptor
MDSRAIHVRTVPALLVALGLAGCAGKQSRREAAEPMPVASGSKSSTVTIKDANGRTTAELLQGKFPGVQVFEAPGGGIQVRIRNSGSINGGGDPLYVVDGLPVSTTDGVLHIEPTHIAKIEVLKDVGSTAIYGIQGANGVVKITTKR